MSTQLATIESIALDANPLPIFGGDSWEDHVSAWIQTSQEMDEMQWRLGAIAASVVGKYKKNGVRKFAGEVMCTSSQIYEYAYVYNAFKVSDRSETLSWTHHRVAANSRNPLRALEEAEADGLSVMALIERVRTYKTNSLSDGSDTCTVADLYSLIAQNKKFKTIYADPAWKYGNQGTRASTDNHYGTMTVDEIAALPVRDLADDDCHLHLWTTNAFLFDCKQIMDAWGFEYKSTFVWVKPQMGMGNYWRVSHEFLLLGVKGKAPFMDKRQMSWMKAERTRHSQKPEAVRHAIQKVSSAPYLELFARRPATGWTVWGDEIKRTMFDAGVAAI